MSEFELARELQRQLFGQTVPDELMFSWESQARQYPKVGKPGISYFYGDLPDPTKYVDCLLYRNQSKGHLIGILNHYPVETGWEKIGNMNLWIRPDRRHRGIGKALLIEANKRWGPINWDQQTYSETGRKFVDAIRKEVEDARTEG